MANNTLASNKIWPGIIKFGNEEIDEYQKVMKNKFNFFIKRFAYRGIQTLIAALLLRISKAPEQLRDPAIANIKKVLRKCKNLEFKNGRDYINYFDKELKNNSHDIDLVISETPDEAWKVQESVIMSYLQPSSDIMNEVGIQKEYWDPDFDMVEFLKFK